MALPPEADQVVVHGWLVDEATGLGVPGTVKSEPVALAGQSPAPLVLSAVSHKHIQTRARTTSPDPDTGYWALLALATNDPDVEAYGGRRVTLPGQAPRTIQVPHNAATTTVTEAMAGQVPSLTEGDPVRAVWFHEAADYVAPTPVEAYYDADQIDSMLATLDARLTALEGG